ncbi:MAG: hypothetical protein ACKO91_18155 [Acidimicrobiales bacterium]
MRPATTLALALLLVAIMVAAVFSLFVLRDDGGPACPGGALQRADGTCPPAASTVVNPTTTRA